MCFSLPRLTTSLRHCILDKKNSGRRQIQQKWEESWQRVKRGHRNSASSKYSCWFIDLITLNRITLKAKEGIMKILCSRTMGLTWPQHCWWSSSSYMNPQNSEKTLQRAAGGLDLDTNICEIRYGESSTGLEWSRSTNLEDTVTTILLFGKDFESFFLIARSYHTIRYLQHRDFSFRVIKRVANTESSTCHWGHTYSGLRVPYNTKGTITILVSDLETAEHCKLLLGVSEKIPCRHLKQNGTNN